MAGYQLTLDEDYSGNRIQGARSYQEDDFGFDSGKPDDFLMVLADGMGGHKGGAQASSMAIEAFMDAYYRVEGSVRERLRYALIAANRRIADTVETQPELQGMGCTLVAVAINPSLQQLEWISVGDSPLWIYSKGRLKRLNRDHSKRAELQKQVEKGEISAEQAAQDPERNALYSALTGGNIDLIDQVGPYEFVTGNRLLLASDGLFALSKQEIEQVLAQPADNMATVVNALFRMVERKQRKGQDNTTVLVARIPELSPPPFAGKISR
ncbi:PP2C family protein-serine/threonine phosphatase [Candidatus Venteria ishoeyi]|uniref:Serine/threonine phosphatase stp n=1 Tax=Candidatus Venteria ishoeyi TaxID=1899563 RepID=A0A1H6FHY5_9GAMM|nr:protein phosphatase 2C domain-containing protein [Candidatus Venteria ishoeyi]SEH08665.1 Serine/threonine phosphatase stp [Candidatus Venteria ishoeyi]